MAIPDLSYIVGFQWDAGNSAKIEKHGVAQAEAEQVFGNEPLIFSEDSKHSQIETRIHAFGRTVAGRLLHTTFTVRHQGTLIRIISSRPMRRDERQFYEDAALKTDSTLPH